MNTDPRVSSNTNREDVTFKSLKKENTELKKELHKLRKIEAGWFGKNKNYIKKEIIIKNNHYHDEIERINTEFTSLTERYNNLELERNALLARNEELEQELSKHNLHSG